MDLSCNQINDEIGVLIGEMLSYNASLEQLDLHWNNIKSIGSQALFSGLKENINLVNLDLKYNALGRNTQIATTISSYLSSNTSLRHLDLSYNFFSLD